MTAAWNRFLGLSWRERWLLVEAATLLLAIGAGLRVCPFRRLRTLLAFFARLGTDPIAADRVAWAVAAAARRLPRWSSGCLPQALAAETLLARRGYRPELRIGVRASRLGRPAREPALEAHAWVELEGAVLVGALDDLAAFAPLEHAGAGASLCQAHQR
jgi:hypothetical protein